MPKAATNSSVAGKAHHTPLIPPSQASRKAMGIMMQKPRKTDIICAGPGFAVEVKYIEIIMLKPANGQAMKYNFNPVTAIS